MRKVLFCSLFLSLVAFALVNAEVQPPRQIPSHLFQDYTLKGQIPVSNWYLNEQSFCPIIFTKEQVQANLQKIAKKEQYVYGVTDTYLYVALDKYAEYMRDKSVAIIGSISPWYESMVIFYGGHPTTIEYNKISCTDPRIEVLTVQEFEKNPRQFDCLLSISSLEHDGLGRYGDLLNPNGDLITMKKMKTYLKDDGLFILSVPVGTDHLWWNAHRIYGKIRLPLLLSGWQLIDSVGFQASDLTSNKGIEAYLHQPVFILKK